MAFVLGLLPFIYFSFGDSFLSETLPINQSLLLVFSSHSDLMYPAGMTATYALEKPQAHAFLNQPVNKPFKRTFILIKCSYLLACTILHFTGCFHSVLYSVYMSSQKAASLQGSLTEYWTGQ